MIRSRALAALLLATIAAPLPAKAADDTLVVGTMWESLPLNMGARRSRFFNESEILDTLIKLDYDMNLVPGLATAWERTSPTTWRFTLRDGVTFHDGTPFNAAAAKLSLERVIALLPYAADLLNIETITAEDPETLVIETSEPFAALPNQLTDAITGIYAASSFDADGKFVKPVGTGPFEFTEYAKQQQTVTERFDDYWGEAPALEKVVYRFIPDHNARTIALETGEIDLAINPLPADVKRLEANDDTTVYAEPSAGLYYGSFNVAEDRPTGDVRVRQAINMMIDRGLVVDAALEGVGLPATHFFSPSFGLVPETAPSYDYDPDAAAALLEEAGYAKVDGVWQKDGAPLTLRVLSYPTRTEMPLITDAMTALLAEQGVMSDVGMFTFEGMMEFVKAGDYDIAVVFWTPEMTGHPDLHLKSQFHSAAGLNDTNWASPVFDAAVDKGRTLDPGPERDATYLEALTALHDDAVVIPLVHKVYTAAARSEVKGFRVHPSGFFYDLKSVSKQAD
ncbi:ABC transporter substrate-binding protein [Acuticoccus mangrovi]|uniref:ABC transporter substrate-binding protein n=1 Tax=Acuticoccus mangrovi TaxID=2796142 RepID=A0A934INU6_9HYPH|nr:ABC transporter substrate-binding protein [Acuticoccus mangrovi]MBJ3776015.1 ABC transporter substrate-binding protein [Acuticoccus mangrovi]